jgi:hypothetical protein
MAKKKDKTINKTLHKIKDRATFTASDYPIGIFTLLAIVLSVL